MFRNRKQAGLLLAEKLRSYQNENAIVLAVPRGGVPVAFEVAKVLNLPLELILTKKIGHPLNKEYAIGAASLSDYFIIPHSDVSPEYINQELQRVRNKLREMQSLYKHVAKTLKGKTAILIDDGVATGNTLMSTIKLLRKNSVQKIIIAVPVISSSAAQKFSIVADEVVAVLIPKNLNSIGAFYDDFSQTSDQEVISYLNQINQIRAGS